MSTDQFLISANSNAFMEDGITSAGMPLTRSCSQEEMAMASVTGVPANMPGVAKKLLGPRRTGEGVDMPCWFMGRRGDGIRRRGVPITAPSDLHGRNGHHNGSWTLQFTVFHSRKKCMQCNN